MKNLQIELNAKQKELAEKQSLLDSYNGDPLRHFEDEITSDHDRLLWESYADKLDDLPFFVCGRGVGAFADFVKTCDQCFYSQSLNNYADDYDITNFEEYTDLESEIEDLESEISDLESQIEDLEEGETE